MKNTTRLVVIYKRLAASVLLQIKKRLESFSCCILYVDPNNDRQLTTMPQEVGETARKVGHPGSAYPRNGDVERIPEWIYIIYLIYMTKQLGSESNC